METIDIKKIEEVSKILGQERITEINFIENQFLPDNVVIISSYLFKELERLKIDIKG